MAERQERRRNGTRREMRGQEVGRRWKQNKNRGTKNTERNERTRNETRRNAKRGEEMKHGEEQET